MGSGNATWWPYLVAEYSVTVITDKHVVLASLLLVLIALCKVEDSLVHYFTGNQHHLLVLFKFFYSDVSL